MTSVEPEHWALAPVLAEHGFGLLVEVRLRMNRWFRRRLGQAEEILANEASDPGSGVEAARALLLILEVEKDRWEDVVGNHNCTPYEPELGWLRDRVDEWMDNFMLTVGERIEEHLEWIVG